ncbi:hypothetical protein RA955_16840 [Geobacillus proteiniphilus]|uniref:Uncharacterized protein n=1 Tax=Geobacillus proteiniphilus TaxID=860353 RepID=A0A1Q5T8Z8_9BACL|nr:hypothetical protein [Geobacillus proteiniphilus]OKO96712.1 hypothetical protein BRO54_0265 [Geobacillus proteiniphilus]OPX04536.1 hypothetical protein B1A75_01925 [Geobacillus sp. LEMMY01]WMJ16283.1 hypothetical protein RA955_16840 [Geobacillus proteiniphilus]
MISNGRWRAGPPEAKRTERGLGQKIKTNWLRKEKWSGVTKGDFDNGYVGRRAALAAGLPSFAFFGKWVA